MTININVPQSPFSVGLEIFSFIILAESPWHHYVFVQSYKKYVDPVLIERIITNQDIYNFRVDFLYFNQ